MIIVLGMRSGALPSVLSVESLTAAVAAAGGAAPAAALCSGALAAAAAFGARTAVVAARARACVPALNPSRRWGLGCRRHCDRAGQGPRGVGRDAPYEPQARKPQGGAGRAQRMSLTRTHTHTRTR
jgi:hypothetical protein